ncbi:hypothetical protein MON38_16940 [Hymenobacter sp. DH14]|uniref:Uncharacterized protein n=1 Tax=Hymenobacter cyanobacteriorum TaxID=2926463 RepID=A0A9X2AGR0_9BACT|nr:hypothetical protein [Hymenobacter cyanobacteriorum]MCI1189112.1 hypothetical protein [Hymenobacter cyanobacteriorum]
MNTALFWFSLTERLSFGMLVLVGIVGGWRYRQLEPALRCVVWLVWFGIAMETATHVLLFQHKPNLWLMPADALGEVALLSWAYSRALGSPGFSRWQPWIAGSFAVYVALSSGLAPEMARFKPGILLTGCLLELAMVGLYFRKLLNELRVPSLAQEPMFWVSTGVLLYGLSKLFISLFSNYMLEHYSRQLSLMVWTIHGLLTIVLYLCYLRAIWLRPQK